MFRQGMTGRSLEGVAVSADTTLQDLMLFGSKTPLQEKTWKRVEFNNTRVFHDIEPLRTLGSFEPTKKELITFYDY
jgi:hypothetical protein